MKHLFVVLIAFLLYAGNSFAVNPGDSLFIRKIYDVALVEGECYSNLRYLCKNIGHRLSGSKKAAEAVVWGKNVFDAAGINCVLQPVKVPHWYRGAAEEVRFKPEGKSWIEVDALALGNSAGTGSKGIRGKIILCTSLEELKALPDAQVKGQIVYFDRPFDRRHIETFHAYGGAVDQRSRGPELASRKGAAGCIVRSMGYPDDPNPHTGNTRFEAGVQPIPCLAISTIAADMLRKTIQSGTQINCQMNTYCQTFPDADSHNVIGEIKGKEFPDQIIAIGGHLDSWDVGEGAHDDGAGVVQSIEALRILKALGYTPRHTVRAILFMNEENGLRGGQAYYDTYENNQQKHLALAESDAGGFSPRGFHYENNSEAAAILAHYMPLLEMYGLHIWKAGGSGADISPFQNKTQALLVGLRPDSQRYFDLHHTKADVFETVNRRELELGAAAMAAFIYLCDKYI